MATQWYAVYTKYGCEQKVMEALKRKGIDSFFPVKRWNGTRSVRSKKIKEPLFPAYVFIKTEEQQLAQVKQMDGVINLVYWLGRPAVIREVEIEMIRHFLSEHSNIRCEKTVVNVSGMVRIINEPLIINVEQTDTEEYKTVKLLLPSLGYLLIVTAESAKVKSIITENSFLQNYLNDAVG